MATPIDIKAKAQVETVIKATGKLANIILGVAPPSFLPSDIAGLKLWLDAGQGIFANSVSLWTDQSGNGNTPTQAFIADQPLRVLAALNGEPVVRFDGSTEELNNSAADLVNNLSAYTYFIVYNPDQTTANQFLLNVSSNLIRKITHQIFSNQIFIYTGIGNADLGQEASTNTSAIIDEVIYDGGLSGNSNRLKYFQNGIQVVFDAFAGTIPASLANSETGFSVGGRNTPSGHYDGDIAEVLVYDTALSGVNLQQVRDYLNDKYAIF